MRAVCVVVGLCAVVQGVAAAAQCSVTAADRIDCFPQPNANEAQCQGRGCCWAPAASDSPLMGQPECFFPAGFGYTASNIQSSADGFSAVLSRNSATPPSPYGGDIDTLALSVNFEGPSIVRVRITDPSSQRWEVPIPTPTPSATSSSASSSASSSSSSSSSADRTFNVTYTTAPFSLTVARASDGTVVLDTALGGLVYSDQFIQWSTRLASSSVYGLGEHVAPLALSTQWSDIPLWARDQGTPEGTNHNLYGVHPLAVVMEPSGNSHGLFFLNSNAQEYILQPTPALTFRTIGGIIDVRVIVPPHGSPPDAIVSTYATQVVGTPYLPPYWALGFNLCRWGYENMTTLQAVHDAMVASGIPYDVQWTDVDAMERHLDFTYDTAAFNGLPSFVDQLHADGRHYINIIDPGISNTQPAGSYPAYDNGVKADVWVKDGAGNPYWAYVWPGNCTFPDFFHPGAQAWWTQSLAAFHDTVQYDSLWIDMNEIATTGAFESCAPNKFNTPPFVPAVTDGSLTKKTMCADAQTTVGRAYDAHSLYGYSEMVATMQALQTTIRPGKRSIVISRSTFAGAGPHGSHWLGDNDATWADLYLSIPGVLSFNLVAIPFIGADICGFGGVSNAELCTRWQQLGAFYPFSRNHNTIGAPAQDPTAFGPATAAIIKDVLMTRYTLLPFLFTLLHDAHTLGTTVARPLFFNFPKDAATLTIDKQFMWGNALLITPVLTQGATSVTGYFPAGVWYELSTGKAATDGTSAKQLTLSAPIDTIPLHVLGGTIIPTQQPAVTTTMARTMPFGAIVALNTSGAATGRIIVDDGETLNADYLLGEFAAAGGSQVTYSPARVGYKPQPPLASLRVFGVSSASGVVVNGKSVSSFTFDASTHVLSVTGMALPLTEKFTVEWH